jgi:ribokinase
MVGNKILVIGSAVMDYVAYVDRFPEPGESRVGKSFAAYCGGKGANQASMIGKLGGEVSFCGCFGDDAAADTLLAGLKSAGVEITETFRTGDASTGAAIICIDETGQNQIVVTLGSNLKLSPSQALASLNRINPGVILLQNEIDPLVNLAVAEWVRDNRENRTLIYNPAPEISLRPTTDFLEVVDLITPNEHELAWLTGVKVTDQASIDRAIDKLFASGVLGVCATLGPRGAYVATRTYRELISAPAVDAVDTVGAGDAFNGGLAFALSRGLPPNLAASFGNFVASISVTRPGAQAGQPTFDELPLVAKAML